MSGKLLRCGLGVLALSAAIQASAAVPSRFTVQGVLRNSQGQLQSMMVSVIASLWDAQSGGGRLGGPYGPTMLMAENGLFTIAFDDPALKSALAPAGVSEVWLEVTVGTDTLPRQLVTSQLFAMLASRADGLSDACSGCVSDAMITDLSGAKLKPGTVPTTALATPTAGAGTNALKLVNLDTTGVVVETLTVNATAGGLIFASANGAIMVNGHTSGTADQIVCNLASNPPTGMGSFSSYGVPNDHASFTGGLIFPLAATTAINVNASGAVVLELSCRVASGCPGGCQVNTPRVQAIFVPARL
jgi:hypothetical protein